MAEFKLQPNRDAWATIRGYCYQVDLCINAWLDIGTNQILLLEHGEDIDVITRSLSTDLVDSIALEQVKHRQKSLTLRSPEIIEFLVNAVIHLNNNPNQNLSIRYLTNTNYGSEQGVKRAPFLREWQQVRQHQYDEPEQTEVANEIHEFLKGTKRPIKIGKDQWKTYTSFIEALSPEKLLDFVGKIHWQFGLPDHEQISESIKLRIITLKYTENSKVAENIYQRLFWFIYSKLSVAGRKELKSEELTKQIEYAISGADAEEIQSLYKRLSSLDVRVSENTKKIADLNERLHKHLSSEEVKDVAIINASEILIDVPPMPHILIDRPQIDQSIEKLLKSSVCVNIHSSIGTGKSLVALQLVRKRNSIIWVRLRDQDTSAALQLLILALKAFLKSKGVVLSNANDLKALLENLPDEISIVIDDCPRMTRSDPLYEVLLIIAERMRKINGILLITGTTPLPGKSSLGKDLIDYPLPPLLDAEAGNLFKVFNAPERFRSAAGAKGFNAIASRNITILLGIIEYLAQNDWKLTAAVISDVLSKKPMEQISDEVVEELIRRVVDTDARELLYRLKLVIHDFTDDTVVKIASIAPAIQDPLTKIHSLKGRWIETVSTGRYNLAPLFKQLPKTMLRSDITKRVYHTLGMMLLEIGTLGPNEVNQSIMYFIGAEEYLIVSDILMKAYMSLSFQEETTDQLLFIKLWKHTSLPKQIPLPRRVIIRTYQLVHTRKDDADFDTILKSIMEMRESLGNDFHSTLAFIMSASIQSLFLGIENIDYAFKLIRQWSIRWDNLSPSEKQLLGSIDQLGPAIIP